jgi:hypothetical protein
LRAQRAKGTNADRSLPPATETEDTVRGDSGGGMT